MKKLTSLILALLLVCQFSLALASVPSKTTGDLTDFIGAIDEDGDPLGDTGFTIVTTAAAAPSAGQSSAGSAGSAGSAAKLSMADRLLKEIAQFIAQTKGSPIRYFGDDALAQAAALLPTGADLDQLALNEFFPAAISGYDSAFGAVTASFTFASAYTAGQQMLAMVGLQSGDQVAWYPMQAVCGEGGVVAIRLTAEVLAMAQQGETVIAILSGQAA